MIIRRKPMTASEFIQRMTYEDQLRKKFSETTSPNENEKRKPTDVNTEYQW